MTDPVPAVAHAGPEHIGRFCRLCGKPITLHQLIQTTGPDAPPVHRICWEHGGGKLPANDSVTEATPGPAWSTPTPALEDSPADQATGLKIFLMILAAVFTLIGPMIGVVVGFLWLDKRNSPLRRRDGRELLIFSAVMFVVELVMLVCLIGGVLDLVRTGAMSPPSGWPFLP